ncbi:histidine phosphatase family protein [Ruegeria arenilitoris]|uniref:histidine phosphatase family protein n=1 Tax=Ruegeria arenilitoris TaxID=1173585 RepID=UPI003463A436
MLVGRIVRYLTHPQVQIDPAVDIPDWSLNDVGRSRVSRLAESLGVLRGTTRIISSQETKAIETAQPLAVALGLELEMRQDMHENDRSATGFLPPVEFEGVADQFFAHPNVSVRGWETASAAQDRIVRAVKSCLSEHGEGDILFVGHGGVGTLLFCALAQLPIDRRYDQGPGGGGNWFQFSTDDMKPLHGWRCIEELAAS